MLTRKEIIKGLAHQGCFPAKYGYRYVIREVSEFEAWQAKRVAA